MILHIELDKVLQNLFECLCIVGFEELYSIRAESKEGVELVSWVCRLEPDRYRDQPVKASPR